MKAEENWVEKEVKIEVEKKLRVKNWNKKWKKNVFQPLRLIFLY